jgi:hypothetical protein
MKNLKKIIMSMVAGLLLFAPVVALAQLRPPAIEGSTNLPDLSNGQGVIGLSEYIINILLAFAGIIAVVFLIIGGYQYIVSAGNAESAEAAKKTIQNAVIGIIIIILSYTVVRVVFFTLT